MAEKGKQGTAQKAGIADGAGMPDTAHRGPLIFLDETAEFGHYSGIVHVTLVQVQFYRGEDSHVAHEKVPVAQLRMSVPAARVLRDTLDKALLMANGKPEGHSH
ncbi:hypothetical protein [Roseomonas gilardii]|uniref:hypothetical protein n=1 Tax=Roseomonas gilardii TaxID=257708 RepID=UPI0011A2E395|nr:hypothetical protein [Roseomonas gilardii]